uniref:Uncharacterized protein n=1 Tax=Tetranychus urticae TaxID=32264 RepID=T1KNU2_TETUR
MASTTDIKRRISAMITNFGKATKQILTINKYQSSLKLYASYSINTIITKLKTVLHINASNYETTDKPPIPDYWPSMRTGMDERRLYGTWEHMLTMKSISKVRTIIIERKGKEILNVYGFIAPESKSIQESQLATLEYIIKVYSHPFTIMLTEEMTKWFQGDSKFIRGLYIILHKHKQTPWTWCHYSEKLDTHSKPSSWIILSQYWNLLNASRFIEELSNNIHLETWKEMDSIWPSLYPTASAKKIFRLIKIAQIAYYISSKIDCCHDIHPSKNIYKKLLIQCESTKKWLNQLTKWNTTKIDADNISNKEFENLLTAITLVNDWNCAYELITQNSNEI